MPPTPTVKQLLLEHIKDFKNFKIYVENRFDQQEQFNKRQEEFNKKQEQFNSEIKNDLKIIKSLPTIKKELKELQ